MPLMDSTDRSWATESLGLTVLNGPGEDTVAGIDRIGGTADLLHPPKFLHVKHCEVENTKAFPRS